MALIECIECGGVVSGVAPACPHCGHPEPGGKAPGTVVENEHRPSWPVFLWTVGGFVVGVLINGVVEAAGIALTDWSTDWNPAYRSSWFWSLLPYAVATLGAFVGLARRHRGKPNPYKQLSLGGAAVVLVGIGVVLFSAHQQASGTENPVAAAATTTTTTQQTSTTTVLVTTTDTVAGWGQETYCDGWAAGVGYANEKAQELGATRQITPSESPCVAPEMTFTDSFSGEEVDIAYMRLVRDPFTGSEMRPDVYAWCSGMIDGSRVTLTVLAGVITSPDWVENTAWPVCVDKVYSEFHP